MTSPLDAEMQNKFAHMAALKEESIRILAVGGTGGNISVDKEVYAENLRLQSQIEVLNAEIAHLKARLNQRKHVYTDIAEIPIQVLLKMRNAETSGEKLNRVWSAIKAYNTAHPDEKINPTAKIMKRIVMIDDTKIKKWIEENKLTIEGYQIRHRLNDDGCNTYNMRYNRKDSKGMTKLAHIIGTIKAMYLV